MTASTQDLFAQIIESMGEDLTRPGLVDTPARAAKAYEFLTKGYNQTVEEVVRKSGGIVSIAHPNVTWNENK